MGFRAALALAWSVHIGMVMNGREQMKQARAKALGRVRRPICASHQGLSNKYALELTLIELGAERYRAFWAQYAEDVIRTRASSKAEWGRVMPHRAPKRRQYSRLCLPLP